MPKVVKKIANKSWFIIATVLLFLLIIPLSLLLLKQTNPVDLEKWLSPNEAFEKGVIDKPYKILEITLRYDPVANPEISLVKLTKKNGYAPTYDETITTHTLILKNNNQIIRNISFLPPIDRQDPPPQEGEVAKKSSVILRKVEFSITVPWDETITDLTITDENGDIVFSSPVTNVHEEQNTPDFQTIPGDYRSSQNSTENVLNATNQKLDIVFIGQSYTNMTIFHNDATRFKNFLLTHEPFKSRAAQIVFHTIDNTSNLQCERDPEITRLLYCNDAIVASRVNSSGVPYDQIVVIVNTTNYGGSGGGNVSVVHRGDTSEYVFVHEFGHSFGRLADEYTVYEQAGTLDNKPKGIGTNDGNCYAGKPPAAAWSGIVKTSDYALGCSYTNWYRSSQSSIMYTLAGTFNAVSHRALQKQMDIYTKATNTPSTGPTKPPIVTKVPSPTRKPSPTPGGNPSDLVVSDVRLTDEKGNVKTNFAVNEKIYVLVTHYNQGGSKAISATGITHSRFYSDKPNAVSPNTDSDVGITMRDGEYGTRSVKSYGSSPAGPNSGFFNNKLYFTKTSPGTYTARHFINSNRDVYENNYNNNQKTLVYTVGTSTPPTNVNPRLSFGPTRTVTGIVPTLRPSEPPAQTARNTLVKVSISFPWLNNVGDNAVYSYREVTLEIINHNGGVISTHKGMVFFKENEQVYTGLINVGDALPTGTYRVKIKAEDTLKKITAPLTLSQGQVANLPLLELVSGDLNGDNLINEFDFTLFQENYPRRYSLSFGCFGSRLCSLTDIDDNGAVDVRDYDLLLQGKRIGKGD